MHSISDNSSETASNYQLVKISNNKFVIMWTEGLKIMVQDFNSKGEVIGNVNSCIGVMSDCKPIVKDNKIIWYATSQAYPKFYQLIFDDVKNLKLICKNEIVLKIDENKFTANGYGM